MNNFNLGKSLFPLPPFPPPAIPQEVLAGQRHQLHSPWWQENINPLREGGRVSFWEPWRGLGKLHPLPKGVGGT